MTNKYKIFELCSPNDCKEGKSNQSLNEESMNYIQNKHKNSKMIRQSKLKSSMLRKSIQRIDMNNETELNIRENNLRKIITLLNKQDKDDEDIREIYDFLSVKNEILSNLSKVYSQVNLSYELILKMKLIEVKKYTVLFKTGDEGKYFFFIISGKVLLVAPIKLKMMMSHQEFIEYYKKLIKHNENEIRKRVYEDNILIFQSMPKEELEKIGLLDNIDMINSNINIENKNETSHLISDRYNRRYGSSQVYDINKNNKKNYKSDDSFEDMNKSYERLEKEDLLPNIEDIYINRIKPLSKHFGSQVYKKSYTVYQYKLIKVIDDGELFGEVALENLSGLRVLTAITKEDTVFAYGSKNVYKNCISETKKKANRITIDYLQKSVVFKETPVLLMERKIIPLMNFMRIAQNQVLIGKEGMVKNNKIIFVKKGEFDIRVNQTISEMIATIKNIYKDIAEEEEIKRVIFEIEELEKGIKGKDRSKYNMIKNIKKVCFGIVKNEGFDILGIYSIIDNYTQNKREYEFEVVAKSINNEVFLIEKSDIISILTIDNITKSAFDNYITQKMKLKLCRMREFLKIRITSTIKSLHENNTSHDFHLSSYFKRNSEVNSINYLNGDMRSKQNDDYSKKDDDNNNHILDRTFFVEDRNCFNKTNNSNKLKKMTFVIKRNKSEDFMFSSMREYRKEILKEKKVNKKVEDVLKNKLNKDFEIYNSSNKIYSSNEKDNKEKLVHIQRNYKNQYCQYENSYGNSLSIESHMNYLKTKNPSLNTNSQYKSKEKDNYECNIDSNSTYYNISKNIEMRKKFVYPSIKYKYIKMKIERKKEILNNNIKKTS